MVYNKWFPPKGNGVHGVWNSGCYLPGTYAKWRDFNGYCFEVVERWGVKVRKNYIQP